MGYVNGYEGEIFLKENAFGIDSKITGTCWHEEFGIFVETEHQKYFVPNYNILAIRLSKR